MKKNASRKANALNEKEVTDLKIKKLTIRSGVKAAAGCNPCHTPHGPLMSSLTNVASLSTQIASLGKIGF